MKKTVIFLIFCDIKRHNFKYIGQFLIKFGHHNIRMHALSFIEESFSLDILPPLKLRKHILPPPKKFFNRKNC